jgi:hypothetical protein
MIMNFTPDETEVVREHIAELQKRARRWRFHRWSAVVFFVFGLGLLLAVDRLAPHMDDILADSMSSTILPDDTSQRLMKSYVDAKIVSLRTEIFLSIKALIVAGIGTSMFVWTMSNRKKDKRDLLLARFLEQTLKESKTVSAQEN